MGFSPGYIHTIPATLDGTMTMATFSISKMKLLCTQTINDTTHSDVTVTLLPETQKPIEFSGLGFFTISRPWASEDTVVDARVPLLTLEYDPHGNFQIKHYFLDPLDPLPAKASFTHKSTTYIAHGSGAQPLISLGCGGQTIVWGELMDETWVRYWLASIPRVGGESAIVRLLEMPDEVRRIRNVCKLALDDVMGRLLVGLTDGGFIIYNLF
jgi:hypothetical protein